MNILPALILASALALPASAQTGRAALEAQGWSLLTNSGEDVLYMKREGPPKDGVHQVWTAYDLAEAHDRDGFSFRSVQSLGEYRCADSASRVVREIYHAAAGLKGETWAMPGFQATEWTPTSSSIAEMKLEFVCGQP